MDGKTLLVAVSRSGETTETIRACETFLANEKGDLLTFSCYRDTPLSKLGKVNVILPSGQEQSVAQTRAFSTLYLGTLAAAIGWAGRTDLYDALPHLPEFGRKLLEKYAPLASDLGDDDNFDRFYWLGSGSRFGLASELSLKMKEMSLSHSESFHFMEFRHGPKSMVSPASLIIGLCSTANARHENAVLEDMKALGGKVIDIAESNSIVRFDSKIDEAVRNILYLPFGQMIALERAISKGLDPDHPPNLDAVVKLS
jgi:glucosamine--fructose-6-phosphate aminotransferase (isomerizing)